MNEKLKHIGAELKGHAPFTIFGATIGLLFMLIFRNIASEKASAMFEIFHPAHVLLSAMVTASMFELHRKVNRFLLVLVVGVVGSIGIASLSDSVIPYIGETLLGLDVPTHADVHQNTEQDDDAMGADDHEHADTSHCSEHRIHLGFIEDWQVIYTAAIIGVIIAYFLPRTKFPHAGHVLLSTWASSAHILMNMNSEMTAGVAAGIFVILFIAVWLPCCISDIVFPLLFVKSDIKLVSVCECTEHSHHSHPHEHKHTEECPEGTEDQTTGQQ
ncbi:MAG: hypothetical protein KAJ07_02760 [Planctomycetes bacterium]|nr:hypothetical protein [Planctomycetota bacterium]